MNEEHRLRVVPVWQLPEDEPDEPAWLIEGLWASQAVGVLGGPPKSCKSWLALEMALAVASGHPCLGRFETAQTGPVLLYAAEDSPRQVRARLVALARAREVPFGALSIRLILESQLRLDLAEDPKRLAATLAEHRPRLLILDPFVRLHRVDENSAADVSALLAGLRAWQREFGVAILLVHHTRKSASEASGSALRGSSDLHAWGDSNLYLRRAEGDLVLSGEHRSARSGDPWHLRLTDEGGSPHLSLCGSAPAAVPDLADRILALLRTRAKPVLQEEIRDVLQVRNQRLTELLWQLRSSGLVTRGPGGWSLSGSPS
jgi:hypothetical protein